MSALDFLLPWESPPQGLVGANPYWVQRGLKSLYSLTPDAWQVNQVTGQVGGTAVGTGVTFPAGFLRTPGSSGNGAALETGLATNIALPITIIVGWSRISGTVSWSWLKNDAAWTGWYGEATGDIKTSNNNSFDGLVSLGASGSYAFSHVSGTSLFGAGRLAAATDTTSTAPVAVDRSSVHLGGAYRGVYDNPAVAEFTYFAAFQGSLSPSELLDLVHTPGLLFAPQTIWVPVSAGGGGSTGPAGLATEADVAQVLAGKQLRALGLATETDAAQALSGKQIRALGLATGTDSALALAGKQLRAVGLSTETDTALALSSTAGAQVGMAVETDTAMALSGVQVRAVGRSDETDTALALSGITGTAPGVASETDTAFALAAVQKLLVGAAQEVDTALRLNAGTGYTDLELIIKILSNRQELNAGTGTFTVYDDDSVSVLFTASAWADAAGTIPYSGGTLGRIDALA